MGRRIYDPTPITSDHELIDVVKSTLDSLDKSFELRIKSIRVQITLFKKDSESETTEPIEIEVER